MIAEYLAVNITRSAGDSFCKAILCLPLARCRSSETAKLQSTDIGNIDFGKEIRYRSDERVRPTFHLGFQAILTLLPAKPPQYLIDVTDRNRLRQEFERLSRGGPPAAFYRLTFPHDFTRPTEVHQATLDACCGAAARPASR